MTQTVTIRVEGDLIEFEIDELDSFEKMVWVGKMPDYIKDAAKSGDTDNVTPNAELIEYLGELIKHQTPLNDELISEIPQDELSHLMEGVMAASFGIDFEDKVRLDDGTDLGGGLFEDLDDWQ